MALGDLSIVKQSGQMLPAAIKCQTQAGATNIKAGEPVKASGVYVVPSADAEPLTSAPTFVGLAVSTSTETASVDGTVDVIPPSMGVVFEASAKSSTAANTDAKIAALVGSLVLLDLTSSTYTIDTAATNAANGCRIVGGDSSKNKVWFIIRSGATVHA